MASYNLLKDQDNIFLKSRRFLLFCLLNVLEMFLAYLYMVFESSYLIKSVLKSFSALLIYLFVLKFC